uniref:Uncharacterized protein n=1 Tax=Anopheles farauti TaxID=69004 RepID=A0A182QVE4_9DIPT
MTTFPLSSTAADINEQQTDIDVRKCLLCYDHLQLFTGLLDDGLGRGEAHGGRVGTVDLQDLVTQLEAGLLRRATLGHLVRDKKTFPDYSHRQILRVERDDVALELGSFVVVGSVVTFRAIVVQLLLVTVWCHLRLVQCHPRLRTCLHALSRLVSSLRLEMEIRNISEARGYLGSVVSSLTIDVTLSRRKPLNQSCPGAQSSIRAVVLLVDVPIRFGIGCGDGFRFCCQLHFLLPFSALTLEPFGCFLFLSPFLFGLERGEELFLLRPPFFLRLAGFVHLPLLFGFTFRFLTLALQMPLVLVLVGVQLQFAFARFLRNARYQPCLVVVLRPMTMRVARMVMISAQSKSSRFATSHGHHSPIRSSTKRTTLSRIPADEYLHRTARLRDQLLCLRERQLLRVRVVDLRDDIIHPDAGPACQTLAFHRDHRQRFELIDTAGYLETPQIVHK